MAAIDEQVVPGGTFRFVLGGARQGYHLVACTRDGACPRRAVCNRPDLSHEAQVGARPPGAFPGARRRWAPTTISHSPSSSALRGSGPEFRAEFTYRSTGISRWPARSSSTRGALAGAIAVSPPGVIDSQTLGVPAGDFRPGAAPCTIGASDSLRSVFKISRLGADFPSSTRGNQ
jgi:hypothetical protein